MIKSDQTLQAMFHTIRIRKPIVKCLQGHNIERICINNQCQDFSLHCVNDQCKKSYQKHQFCNSIAFDAMTKLINKPIQDQKNSLIKMFEIYNQIIKALQKSKIEMIKKLSLGSLEKEHQRIIEEIYTKQNITFAKGKDLNELYKRLMKKQKQEISEKDELLKYFAESQKDIFQQIMAVKQQLFTKYLGNGKYQINSKILNQGQQKENRIKFILKSLNYPKSIQLLYRASENDFSPEIFHQKCDNIENTLTLIRTEFGKTIGGFTPIKWNQNPSGQYSVDFSVRSFIFSLDLMQKMDLVKKQYAIYCYKDYGPTFGGNDIGIKNRCNQFKASHSNFPHSYNFTKFPYTNSQQSYTAFSGGNKFIVIEYEVFRVI